MKGRTRTERGVSGGDPPTARLGEVALLHASQCCKGLRLRPLVPVLLAVTGLGEHLTPEQLMVVLVKARAEGAT
jgi:hypothetical protein